MTAPLTWDGGKHPPEVIIHLVEL